jgi:ATP-dependent RNA helicase DDX49/DBP8
MMKQSIEMTKKPHIVVATPGRLADLMSNGQLKMGRLRYLIFDEADRLVAPESSFVRSEIPTILENAGNRHTQWLFFSATMTSAVSTFHRLKRPESAPFKFDGNSEFGTVDAAQQYFMLVPSQVRDSHLVQLLRGPLLNRTVIIFVGKCKTCELVVGMLRQLKVEVVGLHGQMPQKARIASLNRFKSGAIKLLVTTDVGSRGLDIPSVDVVINFDLPADARDYVHRIGRASRAGRIGSAISLVHELDMDLLKNIEECIQKKLEPYADAPTEKEVVQILNEVSTAKRVASMALHDRKFGEKAETNKKKWST